MITLTISIEEAAEKGRDLITFRREGTPTVKEDWYARTIRKHVLTIATKQRAATKYDKTPPEPNYHVVTGTAHTGTIHTKL